jgi:hypothetical protein
VVHLQEILDKILYLVQLLRSAVGVVVAILTEMVLVEVLEAAAAQVLQVMLQGRLLRALVAVELDMDIREVVVILEARGVLVAVAEQVFKDNLLFKTV